MPFSNKGNIVGYSLAAYPSWCDNLNKNDNLPSIYKLTKIDNLTMITAGVWIKGNITINNRNKRFTIIVYCIPSAVIDRVESIVAKNVQWRIVRW